MVDVETQVRRYADAVMDLVEPVEPADAQFLPTTRRVKNRSRARRTHRRRWAFLVATLAVVVASSAVVVWIQRRGDDPPPSVVATPQSEQGGWRTLPAGPLEPRAFEVVAWTGDEMIVWGGTSTGGPAEAFADGAALDPGTRRWRRLPDSPLAGRFYAAAVWTGRELVVWGGANPANGGSEFADGAAYDPETDRWRMLPPAPLTGRARTVAVWTGHEVVVWGGTTGGAGPAVGLNDGAAYDPETDTWRPIATPPFASEDQPVWGAWTGVEMIVWGISPASDERVPSFTRGAAAYDPASDEWRALPTSPVTRLGTSEPPVWTGTQLVVPGAQPKQPDPGAIWGAAYSESTDDWRPIAAAPPALACDSTAAWTHRVILVYCGAVTRTDVPKPAALAAYQPDSDDWQLLEAPPVPIEAPVAIWSGDDLIVWGTARDATGNDEGAAAAYRPTTTRAAATTAPPTSPFFTMPDGSFSVTELPPGFRTRGQPEIVGGPIPGTSNSSQTFLNDDGGQQLVVSVVFGTPAAGHTVSRDYLRVEPSARRVQDRDTYLSLIELTRQRALFWVIDPTTVAYVIGSNMTDDELFAVAEGVHVPAEAQQASP